MFLLAYKEMLVGNDIKVFQSKYENIIAYSRAILNSGDNASPCFKLFSIGKLEDK